jgi:hypothetical protein
MDTWVASILMWTWSCKHRVYFFNIICQVLLLSVEERAFHRELEANGKALGQINENIGQHVVRKLGEEKVGTEVGVQEVRTKTLCLDTPSFPTCALVHEREALNSCWVQAWSSLSLGVWQAFSVLCSFICTFSLPVAAPVWGLGRTIWKGWLYQYLLQISAESVNELGCVKHTLASWGCCK